MDYRVNRPGSKYAVQGFAVTDICLFKMRCQHGFTVTVNQVVKDDAGVAIGHKVFDCVRADIACSASD